jgi:hypothetical protein
MKEFSAVLHLRSKEPRGIYELGGKVFSCLTAQAATFPNLDPPIATLGTEVNTLDTLMNGKDGSKRQNVLIANQAEVVYKILKLYVFYVNKVAQGDQAIILLSGFDCNNEPTPRTLPNKALIRRIEDGSLSGSVKIYAEALEYADRYKVENATTSTGEWKTLLDHGTLNKLEFNGMERGKEIWLRISGGNSKGWGDPSEPVSFIPR